MATKGKIDTVKVRMYRQGFGDCFLLNFMSEEKRVFTMLIDCGVKYQSERKEVPMVAVVKDLKATLTTEGEKNPKLDVLVVTHEHWDHLSAFYPTKKVNHFKDFKIGQVWLAWTEDPDNDEARTINARLREGVAALGVASSLLSQPKKQLTGAKPKEHYYDQRASESRKEFNKQLDRVMGFYGLRTKKVSESGIEYDPNGEISTRSQKAMENVVALGQAGGGVSYLSSGTLVDQGQLPDGIRVYVLGPPQSKRINQSNASKGQEKETYFSADEGGLAGFVEGLLGMGLEDGAMGREDRCRPFKAGVGITVEEGRQHPFYQQTYYDPDQAHREIEESWLHATGQFALQLDNAINNTSLVLAIEFVDSGKVLLFPGDAQVGSWLSWHDYTWETEDGKQRKTQDLLRNTVLYKVSHHSSHNATLRENGLEMMPHRDLMAMVPEENDSYSGIPHPPLMKRLMQRCKGRVVVSADKNYPAEELKASRPAELSQAEWERFKRDLVIDEKYIEFTVRG